MPIATNLARKNGSVVEPQGFYGYQPIFLKITGTDVVTADTGGGTTAIVEGNLSKTIKAVQTVGSIVYLGNAGSDYIVIAIDGATANPYATANTNTSVTAAVKKAIDTIVFGGSSTVTVVDVSNLDTGSL
jgi:hypothetical protein